MCLEIIICTEQVVVASVGGNAGAGGVMLALGADRVILRDGVVLNPHYAGMGLFGGRRSATGRGRGTPHHRIGQPTGGLS